MLRKVFQIACILLLQAGSIYAQSAQSAYSDAFSAYEAGNYEESLRKAAEVENILGSTNAKLQSLKALNYYENGDNRNALLQLELYFKTGPDRNSGAYSEMSALREEIRSGLQRQFENGQEQLERKWEEETAAVSASYDEQKDLLAFGIAREAGTVEALELFLRSGKSDSLRQVAQKLIEEEKKRLSYNNLVEQGMELLSRGKPSEAKEIFLQASRLKSEPWLQQQIDKAKSYTALLAYNQGLKDFYSGNFRNAIQNFHIALENQATPQIRQKLLQAEEEYAFHQAFNNQDPELMQAYLKKYPGGSKLNQAEAFLFHYYIRQTKANLEMGSIVETESFIDNLSEMRSSKHWHIFSPAYYELVLAQARQLTEGGRKKRQANIGLAIEHYEELDEESGERYRTRLGLLKWKQKEWNRPDMFYLAFKTDPGFNDLGLEFGSHDNNSLGFGVNIQLSKQMLNSDLSAEFELGDLDHVRGLANFNLTKKIFYPVWLYAGGGWANLLPVIPSAEDPGMGIMDDENDVNTVNVQGGVNIHFKPVVLTLGASYPYLSEDNKLKLGMEKNPLYLTLGAGIGW